MTASTETQPPATTTALLFAVAPPVRAAFRTLDHTFPALGAWWACRLWMTLPKPRHQIPPIDPGTPFTVDVGASTVAGRVWGDGPLVYLVHGWAGHGAQLAGLAAPLTGRGYRVVAFDAPSHGRSTAGRHGPRSSSIPEFVDALAAVVALHGTAHAVIAHSMGATATAVAVAAGLTANRLVLLAPMATPLAHAHQLAAVLGFGHRTLHRLVRQVERRVGAPMSRFDVPKLAQAGTMPPVLLVHDHDDRSTPSDHATAIAAAWPRSKLHLTVGLGHTRILRDPAVVATIVDFVSRETPAGSLQWT